MERGTDLLGVLRRDVVGTEDVLEEVRRWSISFVWTSEPAFFAWIASDPVPAVSSDDILGIRFAAQATA